MRRIAIVLGVLAVFAAGSAAAQTTLTPTNAGFTDGVSVSSNGPNGIHFTGSTTGIPYRGFLTYSVPASTTAYTSAVLDLNAATVPAGPNDLEVYDVTSAITTDPAATVFADLGGGVLLGTAAAVANGATFQVTLNPAGLAAVNAARGSTISFGLVNATDGGGSDGIFGTSLGTTPRNLVLTPTAVPPPPAVPTLGEWAMILFATLLVGGAALQLQRRRWN